MLHRYINQFVEYCQLADFSVRSIQNWTWGRPLVLEF